MKRTIEVEDTLQDRVDGAVEEVKGLLKQYLEDNPDTDEPPCINNDLDYGGGVHEIVDSSVPIYTHEIDTTWYLHGNDLEAAYEYAGVGENPRENNGMAAIYCYIMGRVVEWYNENAEDIFDEWLKENSPNGY
ncbi:MAG: hypothetical protein DRJ03_02865 [Chloroflexi bacterium]|nr:MAG: hypothetical protein DRJ03_02865 [Chloroflexota bacterium]